MSILAARHTSSNPSEKCYYITQMQDTGNRTKRMKLDHISCYTPEASLISYFQAWPLCFEPEDTICVVCGSILGRATSPLGSRGGSWFLCGNGIWSVTTKTRLCQNNECRARHSFRDWTSGKTCI